MACSDLDERKPAPSVSDLNNTSFFSRLSSFSRRAFLVLHLSRSEEEQLRLRALSRALCSSDGKDVQRQTWCTCLHRPGRIEGELLMFWDVDALALPHAQRNRRSSSLLLSAGRWPSVSIVGSSPPCRAVCRVQRATHELAFGCRHSG